MMDYDHELRLAQLDAERHAIDALADAYARLDHARAMTEGEHEVSASQLRLVIG